eukprot:4838669-Amphidinium_carterae.2
MYERWMRERPMRAKVVQRSTLLIGCAMYYTVTDTVTKEGCGGRADSQTIKINKLPPTSPLSRHVCVCGLVHS